MKGWCANAVLVLLLAAPAAAGEIVLKNGSRLSGEIASQVLLVSTGTDVVEVASGDVALLRAGEVRLKDGRVVHGTLVGGRLRTRTALGELAVEVDALESFRAEPEAPSRPPAAPVVAPAPPGAPASPAAPPGTAPAPDPVPAAGTAPATQASATGAGAPTAGGERAPAPASGPSQVADGAKSMGRGVADTARGVGATVEQGADRAHDGFKLVGSAIWEGMKSISRAVQSVFTP